MESAHIEISTKKHGLRESHTAWGLEGVLHDDKNLKFPCKILQVPCPSRGALVSGVQSLSHGLERVR